VSDPRLDEVLRAIAEIDPLDEREAASIERLLLEVDRLDSPFDEEADLVHLTASGFVVGTRGTVLHRHRKLGIWVQPGGHVDPGERPAEAARRETFEETGLDVVHPPEGPMLLNVDCHAGPRGHTHLDLRFVLLGAADHPAPPPGESQEVRWCTYAEALELGEPSLRRALGRLEQVWLRHERSWRAIVEERTRGRAT
jgi:ADP-ribose pyrophosphatase YjhB (NUDIX family)